MNEFADEEHLEPYRRAVKHFGPTFEATLWGTEEAQILRFDVMIEMIGVPSLENCRILDIGCGRGDFAERLVEHGIAFDHYVGLDAMPEMIEAAQARGLARCEFEVANVLADLTVMQRHAPDFACISGALNTMDDSAARRVVHAALDAAAQGVIFNFLSNRFHPRWADQNLGPARRFNTAQWLDWAMTVSPRVSFTQDYLDGHDATIFIRHA